MRQLYGRALRIRRRAEFLEVQQGATSRIRTASLLVLARARTAHAAAYGPPREQAAPIEPASNEPAATEPATTEPASAALPTRLGVVASRRIGGAVQRNRAKRLIREAFRRCHDELPPALDVVVIASPAAPSRTFAEIERELARVRRDLRRAFGRGPVASPRAPG